MFCLLCQKYKHIVCSRRGAWITTPCISYRCDKVVQHGASTVHKQAVMLESTASAVANTGGLEAAFCTTLSLQKKALVGALKCMYWLAKSEIAHTIHHLQYHYNSFITCISLIIIIIYHV